MLALDHERARLQADRGTGERRLFEDDLTSRSAYQSRYAISNNASQRSARADARSSEPGLDIPQTRQRLEPARTSAPQPLQAKANIAPESLILTARTLRRCDYSAFAPVACSGPVQS